MFVENGACWVAMPPFGLKLREIEASGLNNVSRLFPIMPVHLWTKLWFEIVLSFAPSAAAGWHCSATGGTCEKNLAWQNLFFVKRWVLPPFSLPKNIKKQDGVLAIFCQGYVKSCIILRISHDLYYFCSTLPPLSVRKTLKKQDGMLAIFSPSALRNHTPRTPKSV